MDINDLRSLATVTSLLVFLGLIAWAMSRRNRHRFDEAAQLPFLNEDAPGTDKQSEEAK